MRDWGWQDRAEWSSQNGYGRDESRPRNHFGGAQKAPVWGEWEGVTEEYFGTVIWEWYLDRCNQIIERKEEKIWDEKVRQVIPMILEITAEHGCTDTVYAAMAIVEGRKPKSRSRAAGGDMVALWRGMSVQEIIAHTRAHILAEHSRGDGEVVETRVTSAGTIPNTNPFAALKGKF